MVRGTSFNQIKNPSLQFLPWRRSFAHSIYVNLSWFYILRYKQKGIIPAKYVESQIDIPETGISGFGFSLKAPSLFTSPDQENSHNKYPDLIENEAEFSPFYPHFLSTCSKCSNCNFCGEKQPSIVLQGLKIEIQIVFTCEMIRSSGCQLTDANKVKRRNSKKNTLYIDFD